MNLITREELMEKLDRNDEFKLIMVLGDWQFRAKHIPGSLNISSPDDPKVAELALDDEIVVYCSSDACVASSFALRTMTEGGFSNVRRYAGGIADWEEAGLTLIGEMVS